MIPRYGRPPKSGQRYRVRPGAYAILPRGQDLLLTWQDDPHYEIQLPGGGIDPGESPVQALHREVFEETGWRIARPLRFGTYRRFTFMPEYDLWAEKICHIFLAWPVRSIGQPSEQDHTPIWLPANDTPRLLASSGDAKMLARYLQL